MKPQPARDLGVPAGALIGWAGLLVHNLAELPGQGLRSPESLIPLIVTVTLIAGWFTQGRSGAAIGLLCWGPLHLLGGGILSVLPLPFLPFAPEQSASRYLFHAIYALAQLPLVISTVEWLHSHRQTSQQHASGMRREMDLWRRRYGL